jgi:UDP-hydrolysing UDP-N-acetyl-D-glucosamine 2-epimerase
VSVAARVISLLTTGRADWGLVAPIARAMAEDVAFDPCLIVAAAHLDEGAAGLARIEGEGFAVTARLPWGQGTPARRAARTLEGMAELLAARKPDPLLIVGDRFEVMAAAQAATLVGVPLLHLGGGDVTEGAIDDAYRHALTKLSHVHLATHEEAGLRVQAMGEDPARVHVVGNPALDGLRARATMPREALEAGLGAPLGDQNLLVTFHPVTLAADRGAAEFEAVLATLERLDGWTIWVSEPNDDPGGAKMRDRLRAWAKGRSSVNVRRALGPLFPALAAASEAVLGNSSAGLAEVPTLGVATVDVGSRQQGRLAGDSVIHSEPDPEAILAALERAQTLDRTGIVNPYGDGASTPRILSILRDLPPRDVLLRKRTLPLEGSR